MRVDLLVPVKPLAEAKTRLRGTAGGGVNAPEAHARLVIALARDTLAAATGAAVVRKTLAVCSDEVVCSALAADGVETIPDAPGAGLNPALRYGEAMLRGADPSAMVGALQADLPALRPEELDCAVRTGLATSGRAFCTDRAGTGTTLRRRHIGPRGLTSSPVAGPGCGVTSTLRPIWPPRASWASAGSPAPR
jgi:2-phospho-L-lactate guanylyltransferase